MVLSRCLLLVVLVVPLTTAVNVTLTKRSTLYLPYEYNNGAKYELDTDAAQELSYDHVNKILYTVGEWVLHAINVSNTGNMTILSYLQYPWMEFTDVEYCGGYIFTTLDNKTDRAQGKVIVFSRNTSTNQMQELVNIPVGVSPDGLKLTSDCSKLVVAVEGKPYEEPLNQITDPPGLVVIITFNNGVSSYTTESLDFTQFDNLVDNLRPSGVRHVYQNSLFSNDLEPESVTISPDGNTAYITLQENNAVAKVDLTTKNIDIYGLGFKDWSASKLDPSDKDAGANLQSYAIKGMYQPEATALFSLNGVDYLVMANEGSERNYRLGSFRWKERTRGSQLPNGDLGNIDATTKSQLTNNTLLGRLQFSTSKSGRFSNGTYRDLYSFGGRSWSIRRADDMTLVYDSGDQVAQLTIAKNVDLFNTRVSDGTRAPNETFDTRSDNRGAEPEHAEVGRVGSTTLIFIANEKPGTIMTYSVTSDATQPQFQHFYTGISQTRGKTWIEMYNDRTLSEVDTEDLKFIPASESPVTGQNVLFAAASVSGTVSILDVNVTP